MDTTNVVRRSKMKKLQVVAVIILAVVLQGCATNGRRVIIEAMPSGQYLDLSEEGKQEYFNALDDQKDLSRKDKKEFMAGIEVCHVNDSIERCAWYDSLLKVAYIRTKAASGAMGINSHGDLMVKMTDEGEIVYFTATNGVVKPVTILANIATQQGWGRFLGQILGNVAAGAANGVGAGLVNRLIDCDGCGGSGVVNQNFLSSSSGASAGSSSSTEAVLGVDVIPTD